MGYCRTGVKERQWGGARTTVQRVALEPLADDSLAVQDDRGWESADDDRKQKRGPVGGLTLVIRGRQRCPESHAPLATADLGGERRA
jgi:hypothetical protein